MTAEVSEYVVTVVIVRWSTQDETSGHVEFGESEDYTISTGIRG